MQIAARRGPLVFKTRIAGTAVSAAVPHVG
jgi:hypothetical protein